MLATEFSYQLQITPHSIKTVTIGQPIGGSLFGGTTQNNLFGNSGNTNQLFGGSNTFGQTNTMGAPQTSLGLGTAQPSTFGGGFSGITVRNFFSQDINEVVIARGTIS